MPLPRPTGALRVLSRSYASVASPSKLTVVATDAGQPTTSLTLLVKAGSRYEPEQGAGLAHVLKNFGFKGSKDRSALRTVREAELYGGLLSATLTREYIAFTAEFLRGDEAFFFPLIASSLTSPKLALHELAELVLPTVHSESHSAVTNGPYTALELAHSLAFRNGLGRAMLAHPSAHPSIDAIRSYAASAFSQGNLAVLGSGISQESLESLTKEYLAELPASGAGALTSPASKYHGGTALSPSLHPTLFIGYGFSGPPTPALAALAGHLSPKPAMTWSAGLSPLANLPKGTHVEVLVLPYSDATLFGVVVTAKTTSHLREAGERVAKTIKEAAGGNLNEDATTRAKAKARFAAASIQDGKEGLLLKGRSAMEGKAAPNLVEEVEKIDAKAVGKFAADMLKSKPTYVAMGDINALPHADELGL